MPAETSHLQGEEKNFTNDDTVRASVLGAANARSADEEEVEAFDSTSPASDDGQGQRIREVAWGRCGKIYMWAGIALMWTVFELDHTTVYNYQNYAASEFRDISALGALTTAGTIVQAVMKPPIAKISDVVGRAETYCGVVFFYVISYILCASSPGFNQYVGGYIIYCIGATGMQILNQVIVADITSSQWRGLANGLINLPFMIIPWASAFISNSALQNIGWRWGIGMLAIILPACSTSVIAPLFFFQRRVTKLGGTIRAPMSFSAFISNVDLIGLILLSSGFALIFIPLSLAGNTANGWSTPWIPITMVIGILSLTALTFYEIRIATHPIIPAHFLRNKSILLAWSIGLLDAFAFNITHTYMYAWSTVVHNFSARTATFLTYTSGCMQVLTGLLTGYIMYRSKRYKWLLIIGAMVRLVGYGIMIRLRGAANSTFELFLVQIIQGAGSGVVGTVVLVVAQIVVCREELAQSTALELLFIYLGQALGSAGAGAIYTNLFKGRLWFYMGREATKERVDGVYDSITDAVARLSNGEKGAVDHAYSDVLRYMSIAAIVASALPMIVVWWLPNLKLGGEHNLAGNQGGNREEGSGNEGDSKT